MQEKSKIFLIWVKTLKAVRALRTIKDERDGANGHRNPKPACHAGIMDKGDRHTNAWLSFQFGVEGGDDEAAES